MLVAAFSIWEPCGSSVNVRSRLRVCTKEDYADFIRGNRVKMISFPR
jgi:hypothetical protein